MWEWGRGVEEKRERTPVACLRGSTEVTDLHQPRVNRSARLAADREPHSDQGLVGRAPEDAAGRAGARHLCRRRVARALAAASTRRGPASSSSRRRVMVARGSEPRARSAPSPQSSPLHPDSDCPRFGAGMQTFVAWPSTLTWTVSTPGTTSRATGGRSCCCIPAGWTRAPWRRTSTGSLARFRVFTPERRGHGRTADVDGPITYELMAADTIAFMERVVGAPAHLVGSSDGAVVALVAAMRRPDLVRRLVLVAGVFNRDGWVPEAVDPDAEPPEFMATGYAEVSPDGREHFPIVAAKLARMRAEEPTLAASELSGVSCHTLVMVGDDDEVTLSTRSSSTGAPQRPAPRSCPAPRTGCWSRSRPCAIRSSSTSSPPTRCRRWRRSRGRPATEAADRGPPAGTSIGNRRHGLAGAAAQQRRARDRRRPVAVADLVEGALERRRARASSASASWAGPAPGGS